MTNKSLSLFVLAILSFAIFASFASAAIITQEVTSSTPITGITLNQFGDTQTFKIFNSDILNTVTLNPLTPQTITDKNGKTATINFVPSSLTILPNSSITVTANVSNIQSNFALESTSKDFNITTSNPLVSSILTLSVTNTVCEFKDDNNLQATIDSIKVTKGYGKDTDWYPLDTIEAKVNVENTGSEPIKNIVVNWEVYDVTTKKRIMHGEENDFTLKNGNDKTVTFSFKLDSINNLDSGDTYKFYVWATVDDEEFSGNPSTCVFDNSNYVNINMDSHFVVLDSLTIPDSASCGTTATITGTAWNIGSDDEQNVYLWVTSTQLGINQKIIIGDINQGESQDFSFNLNVPDDAQKGTYALKLEVYDDSNAIFENDNGDKSQSQLILNLNDSCSATPKVSVSADLTSTAKAGSEIDVKATIANTGSTTKTFTLSLGDYSTWASSATLDRTSVTLASGASQDVVIKLQSNKDSSGNKQFNLIVNDGTKVLSQPVKISVSAASVFPNITGLFTSLGGNNNLYLWGIGALNAVLIIIIIAVAVRVIKKR
jgi:hypothetical protein